MEIINISDYNETRFHTGVALGNFDGLHIGHQKLIETMIEESKGLGLKSSLLLFKKHTKAIIDGGQPEVITTNEQKFKIAEDLGVDVIYIMDFDKDIMKLSGEEFIKKIIVEKMNAKLLVVGFDYRFGHKASGDSNHLLELGEKYKIHVTVLDPILDDKDIISSTKIRKLITIGEVAKVNKYLSRPYSIVGKVIPGSNRGNKLGYPTANIKVNFNYIIPKIGVYKSETILNSKTYSSLTNVGYNPTFNEDILKIETHILNFDGNIYGQDIEIRFLQFLREDIKFNNKNELINQINQDISMAQNKN